MSGGVSSWAAAGSAGWVGGMPSSVPGGGGRADLLRGKEVGESDCKEDLFHARTCIFSQEGRGIYTTVDVQLPSKSICPILVAA